MKKKEKKKKKKDLLTFCMVVGSLIHVAVRNAPRRRRNGRLGPDACPSEVPNEVLHLGEASDHTSGFPLGYQSVKVHGENCKWQIANRHHFPYKLCQSPAVPVVMCQPQVLNFAPEVLGEMKVAGL